MGEWVLTLAHSRNLRLSPSVQFEDLAAHTSQRCCTSAFILDSSQILCEICKTEHARNIARPAESLFAIEILNERSVDMLQCGRQQVLREI
jgi:hypothetical protein